MGLPEARVDQECVEAYLFHRAPTRFLIFRRPPDRQRIWVPVSGKVDLSDLSPENAVRRELLEETGFHEFVRLFPLDWTVRFEGPDGGAWRLTAFAAELDGPRVPQLSAEHEAFEWVDPAEAAHRLHFEDNRAAIGRLLERLDPRTGPSAPNV